MKSALQATDIYSAVWPLYVVSKISGLAPYPLIQNRDFEKSRTIYTCLSRMWSFILMILLVAWGCICIRVNVVENSTVKRTIVDVTFILSLYSCGIISLILSLTVNRHKVSQTIAKLSETDYLLSAMKYGYQTYKNTKVYLIIQFTILYLSLYYYFLIMRIFFVVILIY
jgi:hypothetical protein